MRVFTAIILTIMLNCSYASVTMKQAREVLERLDRVTSTHHLLWRSSSKEVNAHASWSGIYINQGMLEFLDNEDELAEILGHELGHIHYGDVWQTHYKAMETRADIYGFNLAKAAGFNACNGAEVMHKFEIVFGNRVNNTHPQNRVRYDTLEKFCKK